MASCPKCGRTNIKKNRKTGKRACRRCGELRGPMNLNRCGVPQPMRCEQVKQ